MSKDGFVFFHNPRCSKSNGAMKILEDRDIEFTTVLYLESPPTPGELKGIASKLGIAPRELLRTGEAEYKDLGLDDALKSDEDILQAMSSNPILIQRPILIRGDRAVIGRPPDNVNALLDND